MIEPNPDHPIVVAPFAGTVVVAHGGTVIAETRHALALHESTYPVVYYVPKADVAQAFLVPSDHSTHCPYKGDASYWSVEIAGTRIENAVWSYERPLPGVSAIKDYLAFYPKKLTVTATEAGRAA
nr:DUF427 domain-containing protein [Amorphus coralli]